MCQAVAEQLDENLPPLYDGDGLFHDTDMQQYLREHYNSALNYKWSQPGAGRAFRTTIWTLLACAFIHTFVSKSLFWRMVIRRAVAKRIKTYKLNRQWRSLIRLHNRYRSHSEINNDTTPTSSAHDFQINRMRRLKWHFDIF
uniref:Uncharacterized protein n=1 Tax=Vitrella brassicaformis TaxID=1169539 RepID=A0A7S1P8R0_9ALVE